MKYTLKVNTLKMDTFKIDTLKVNTLKEEAEYMITVTEASTIDILINI